jgi:hypothetical protein
MYTPDNWVIIKIMGDDPHYRVLAGWSGGYTSSDHWRMNSGITKVEEEGDFYLFSGASGSTYKCHKDMYRLRNNNAYVWNSLQQKHGDKVALMYEDTNWLTVDWIIK